MTAWIGPTSAGARNPVVSPPRRSSRGYPADSFESVNFVGADLTDASINDADLTSCCFADAALNTARFVRTRLTDCLSTVG